MRAQANLKQTHDFAEKGSVRIWLQKKHITLLSTLGGLLFFGFLLVPVQLRAAQGACTDQFQKLANSGGRWWKAPAKELQNATRARDALIVMNREDEKMARHVSQISWKELIAEGQLAITELTARKGYLPGCTPQATPADVQALVKDYQSTPAGASALHQVTANMDIFTMLKEGLALSPQKQLTPNIRSLVERWEQDAWNLRVFQELEKRLLHQRSH